MSGVENPMQRSWCFHASKTEVVGPGIDLAFATRAHDVAGAILLVAEKRTPFMDALLFVGLRRIEGSFRTLRVSGTIACLCE